MQGDEHQGSSQPRPWSIASTWQVLVYFCILLFLRQREKSWESLYVKDYSVFQQIISACVKIMAIFCCLPQDLGFQGGSQLIPQLIFRVNRKFVSHLQVPLFFPFFIFVFLRTEPSTISHHELPLQESGIQGCSEQGRNQKQRNWVGYRIACKNHRRLSWSCWSEGIQLDCPSPFSLYQELERLCRHLQEHQFLLPVLGDAQTSCLSTQRATLSYAILSTNSQFCQEATKNINFSYEKTHPTNGCFGCQLTPEELFQFVPPAWDSLISWAGAWWGKDKGQCCQFGLGKREEK